MIDEILALYDSNDGDKPRLQGLHSRSDSSAREFRGVKLKLTIKDDNGWTTDCIKTSLPRARRAVCAYKSFRYPGWLLGINAGGSSVMQLRGLTRT